jgi:hypothetical protein
MIISGDKDMAKRLAGCGRRRLRSMLQVTNFLRELRETVQIGRFSRAP